MTTLVDTCVCGAPWSMLPLDHVCGGSLSAWSERRPERDESQRRVLAERLASHLPEPSGIVRVSDADLEAMRAAFTRRFDEDLPRTETLMAVAHIGYRMALRDRGKP